MEGMIMIQDITARLYADRPRETLYHYTTLKGLLGIVSSRCLWASDIRYMNDSAEMKHAADLIKKDIARRIAEGHPNPKLLNQFQYWVGHRIDHGHMLFSASFRSNGNLLSQWRGYSTHGKGVSIGFDPGLLLECARGQSLQVARCIYDPPEQERLVGQVVDAVEALAGEHGECTDRALRPPDQSYHDIFDRVESDLLRIAAVLKDPSFKEEEEWRVVSPVLTDFAQAPIRFREGTSMLVPYLEFRLTTEPDAPLTLEHLYLGPSPNSSISMNSLELYLARNGIRPTSGISYCQIPYRQR
jgi:hypothetical protein